MDPTLTAQQPTWVDSFVADFNNLTTAVVNTAANYNTIQAVTTTQAQPVAQPAPPQYFASLGAQGISPAVMIALGLGALVILVKVAN